MATKFLEPGGDVDELLVAGSLNTFWSSNSGATIASDFVHGGHVKSIRYAPSVNAIVLKGSIASDSGTRVSFYIYFAALPNATATFSRFTQIANKLTFLRITSGGVIQLWDGIVAQIGTNGATLSTGVWYHISLAYTISSTSVNRFELFVNEVSSISITNATLSKIGGINWGLGNVETNSTMDFRSSDHYVDDSSALTNPGNIWVTAKRPIANGTTNGFTTQIGAGGSGVGTGHSPQVNERPLSTTNGWSIVTVASAITEEYNIQSVSAGDINITGATIVDYVGWVSANSLNVETGSIIVNNVSSNITLVNTITMFTKIAGSTSYPAGTGTDIGIITTAIATTVSLYECGVIVAYIPASGVANTKRSFCVMT